MLNLLRTPRWLGFTAVVLIAIIAFGLLSAWQWSRAEQHRTERIALAAALAQAPRDLSAVVDESIEWTPVTVQGSYRADLQVVVRKRPMDSRNGFWLMTPLERAGGSSVWVNRGWLPVTGDALATPELPTPPAGTVTVTGLLRPFDTVASDANEGLPAGQISAPALSALPQVDAPVAEYVQLLSSDPEQDGLVPLPMPEIEMDEGRNISYAVQWLLFAGVAIVGWFFFLRREAREDAEQPTDVDDARTPTSVT